MDKSVHLSWYINQNPIFNKFPEKDKERLANLAVRRIFQKGETVALQGSEWKAVLIITSGLLRSVIYSPDGRRHVVTNWDNGGDFWSHTTLDDEPLLASLEAVKISTVYQWSGDDVLDLVLRHSAATRALLHRQTQLIRKRRDNIYNLAFNQVTSRVARIIVEQFPDDEIQTLQRDFTLVDLAEMAATSPEVVCRILYRFQDQGFLKLTRASITLGDRDALRNLIASDIDE